MFHQLKIRKLIIVSTIRLIFLDIWQKEERLTLSSEKPPQGSPLKDEKHPLLYVDVNLGPGHCERIVVYEGDTA